MTVFKTISSSWFLNLNLTFFRDITKSFYWHVDMGNPLANVSKVVGNPLENFMQRLNLLTNISWVPEGIRNCLTNSLEKLTSFCK